MPNPNFIKPKNPLFDELNKRFKDQLLVTGRASDPPAGEPPQESIPIIATLPTLSPRQPCEAIATPTLPAPRRRKKQELEQERQKLLQLWNQLTPEEKKLQQWDRLQQLPLLKQLELLQQWQKQWEQRQPWEKPSASATAPALPLRWQQKAFAKQEGTVPRQGMSERQKELLKQLPSLPPPRFPSDEQSPLAKQSGAVPRQKNQRKRQQAIEANTTSNLFSPPLAPRQQQPALQPSSWDHHPLMEKKQSGAVPRQRRQREAADTNTVAIQSLFPLPPVQSPPPLPEELHQIAQNRRQLVQTAQDREQWAQQQKQKSSKNQSPTKRTSVNSLYGTSPSESQPSLFRRESVNSLYGTSPSESQPSLFRQYSPNRSGGSR